MKLFHKFILSLLATILVTACSIIFFMNRTLNAVEAETRQHLLKLGYSTQEIYSINAKWGYLPRLSAVVIFKDELVARYYYKRENKQIIQFSRDVVGINHDYSYLHIESKTTFE